MANPMKYVKDLEAAGFDRLQAEAQVKMVLDALGDNLATKVDFTIFQERLSGSLNSSMDSRFARQENAFDERMEQRMIQIDNRFEEVDTRIDQIEARLDRIEVRLDGIDERLNQIDRRFDQVDKRFVETEFRIVTRLGFLIVSTTSIAVAVLTWLIKH